MTSYARCSRPSSRAGRETAASSWREGSGYDDGWNAAREGDSVTYMDGSDDYDYDRANFAQEM